MDPYFQKERKEVCLDVPGERLAECMAVGGCGRWYSVGDI